MQGTVELLSKPVQVQTAFILNIYLADFCRQNIMLVRHPLFTVAVTFLSGIVKSLKVKLYVCIED